MSDFKKTNSLSKKATSNAISGFVFFIVNTLVALALNPILVSSLGSVYFGVWKAIDSFLGFASIADGKGTQALKWTIANQESDNDFNKKKRNVGSALVVWFVFLPILVIIIGLLTYFSPFLINGIKTEDYDLIRIIVLLLGLNLILTPLLGISESVLVGVNNGHIANYIKSIWIIFSALLMYVALFMDYGIKELAIIIILITLLRGIHFYKSCKLKVEWFSYAKPRKHELLVFFKFSSWKLIWSFIARFLMTSEIIFLSILIGATSVSQYIFTGYISVVGITVAAIISSAITPGLGRIIGNMEYIKSQSIISQLRELVLGIGLLITAGILLLNQSFVLLWVGRDLFLGTTSNFLIAALMIQLIIIRNEAFLIDLSLNIKQKVIIGVITVVMISISILILYYFVFNELNSVFLGILIGRMFMFFYFPVITNKMVKSENKIKFSYKCISFSIAFLGIVSFVGSLQLLETWTELLFIGMFEIVLSALYIYYFIITGKNKDMVNNKLRGLKNKIL